MSFNPADFRHHLEDYDLSEAEKDDYIRTLAGVLDGVIDEAFRDAATNGGSVDKSSNSALTAPDMPSDMVELLISNEFNTLNKLDEND